jgi:peptidyl-dipeptidase Dcp
MAAENPILTNLFNKEFGIPNFSLIKPEHFEEAFETAISQQLTELQQISQNTEQPTFQNTVELFDRCGELFASVYLVFHNLCASVGVPELQKVEMKLAGKLAAHRNSIYTTPGLFERVNNVYESRNELSLNVEQIRLVERFHLDFVRAGAKFDEQSKTRYSEIVKKLAELTTQFTQNVVADESDITIALEEKDKEGLPTDLIEIARQAATARKLPEGSYVITLSRSLVVLFLTFSPNAKKREEAWRLWTSRGELHTDRNNLKIAHEILKLRAEQAKMHGYKNYAEYATADTMAGTPDRVMELLERVWEASKISIHKEEEQIIECMKQHNPDNSDNASSIEPWDWRYYSEKVRQANYNLDDSEVKPYFPLSRMVEAIFDCANKLYGLTFKPRPDLISYHPDVKTYEVHETVTNSDTGASEDRLVAIFLHDNYARPHKKSGAWMSNFRIQCKNIASSTPYPGLPIVVNNNNFNRGDSDATTLLSIDVVKTLFLVFGHGLHVML